MFRVVEGSHRTFWCASDGSSTYYVGQLVAYSAASKAATNGAVVPLAVPAGEADTTNFQIIAGVVVGLNTRTPTSNSTGDYQTGVVSSANQKARDWMFAEGMYAKGDPQLLVQIAEITPSTVIEGDIRNAAVGTLCTVNTVSASTDADGMISANVTTDTIPFTPVLNKGTIYCRTGANAGLYRVNKNTSTTAPTLTTGFPNNVAVADTFVIVPLKQGLSQIYIGGPGLYIDQAQGPGSGTTFQIICYKLDLAIAGREKAHFRFTPDHFCFARA